MRHPFLDWFATSVSVALVLGFGGSEAHFFSLTHAPAAFVGTGTGLAVARLHTRPPLWRLAIATLCGVSLGFGLFAVLTPVHLLDAGSLLREATTIFVALMLGFGVSRIGTGIVERYRPDRHHSARSGD